MARQALKATLTKIQKLTPTVYELVITPMEPKTFSFKTGQFVMLHIPQDGQPKPALRAYSIASNDSVSSEYRLVIKCYQFGVASTWVPTLTDGQELEYTGPFGKFLFREAPAQRVVFVGTGTGLAPLISMVSSRGQKHPQVDFQLLLGVWNEDEIYYKKELEEVKSRVPNFKYDYVLDAPKGGDWKGLTGRVTDHINKMNLTDKTTEFYLCGNPAMIKSVKELLASKGFPADKVYTESFG